jgi:uncharacterized membrane protein YebE (DUF533 family)
VAPLVLVGAVALAVLLLGGASPGLQAKSIHFGLPAPPPNAPPPPPPPPNPPPRPQGLTFETRNLTAINALVGALIADSALNAATYNIYAEQFALYGFDEQANALRAKALTAPKYTQQEIQSGVSQLWEQQAKQGFW